MREQLIGLSVSFCVRDIADGKVDYDQVLGIVGGTCFTPRYKKVVISGYSKSYWAGKPKECKKIFNQIIKDKLLIQPRLAGHEPPFIRNGHWLKVRDAFRI